MSGPLPATVVEKPKPRPACVTVDPETFFGDDQAATSVAKSVCVGCPLRLECLTGALARREAYGVWGATTPKERSKALSTCAGTSVEAMARRLDAAINRPGEAAATPAAPMPRPKPKAPRVRRPRPARRAACPSETRYRRHKAAGEDCEVCLTHMRGVWKRRHEAHPEWAERKKLARREKYRELRERASRAAVAA